MTLGIIDAKTIFNVIIGGVIALLVAVVFYKKTSRDLENKAERLTQAISILELFNKNILSNQDLQITRDLQKDSGEEFKYTRTKEGFGAATSDSLPSQLTVSSKLDNCIDYKNDNVD